MAKSRHTDATLACLLMVWMFVSEVAAFSVNNNNIIPNTHQMTRKDMLQNVLIGITGSTAILTTNPGIANADVSNKVASAGALRKVKRAQRQVTTLLPYLQDEEYAEVINVFRTSPLADVRKNCRVLILGGEDGPKAVELEDSYKSFITSVEKFYSSVGGSLRGRKISATDVLDEYNQVTISLESFIKVAEEAAEIPVQYENDESATISTTET